MTGMLEATPTPPDTEPVPQPAPAAVAGLDNATGHKNMLQLIELRWMAAAGQVMTINAVHYVYGIQLPLNAMFAVLGCLLLFNLASFIRWRTHRTVSNQELFSALLVDVAILTAQLYLSGGVTNPFVYLYLLQVILGAVLLKPWSTWTIVGVTSGCLVGLALVSRPLILPPGHGFDGGIFSPYIQGMLVCFTLNAALLVTFITRINRNLRERDQHLADLRQRTAEEDNIVRMGLLASGAAHELGTPLATLSVILGDWQHMAPFTEEPELLQEISEMQIQLQRCKSIVSGILLSLGEARGESSEATTIATFLDDLVDEWRATRPAITLVYRNYFGEDLPMVADSVFQQMLYNLLDNAQEASPQWVSLEAEHIGDDLQLTVSDQGRGFSAEMIKQLGKPYQSSKGRPGAGLGLFLVVNVVRTLGGKVQALNRPLGGASVVVTLPLRAITITDN